MPSYVDHRVFITGNHKKIEQFAWQHIRWLIKDTDVCNEFDFNTVIPVPEGILNIIDGAVTREAIALQERIDKGDVTAATELKKLNEEHPFAEQQGRLCLKMRAETGFDSWYSWSNENWGTDRNALNTEILEVEKDFLELIFQTAWSPPLPIMEKVAAMWPDLSFEIYSFDGLWGFAGHGIYNAGQNPPYLLFKDSESMEEINKKVYSESPSEE